MTGEGIDLLTYQAPYIDSPPIDDTLHVIIVISNPCHFKTRIRLAREFIERMRQVKNITLYVVEMIYDSSDVYEITDQDNICHLQIHYHSSPIWSKENMVNMAVDILLPSNWKAMAWIDADIEFENDHWVQDTLKILHTSRDIVQLFSHCIDMAKDGSTLKFFSSFGYQYIRNDKNEFWHPGYAWAMNRRAFDKLGGLYDYGILGSGDNNIAHSILGTVLGTNHKDNSKGYRESLESYQMRARGLRLGFVPGVIRHYFHGSKKNRKYGERWKILIKYQYDPYKHIIRDEIGLLYPSKKCPRGLLLEIERYFQLRNEDE